MTEPSYRLSVPIAAPPAAVYAALTDAAALRAWLAEHAEVNTDERVFEFWGRYTPDGERGRQRLLGFEPGRRLSFGWQLHGAGTEVAVELEPGDGGTVLTLAHSGVPPLRSGGYSMRDLMMLSLANLASYCEGRELGPRCDFTALGTGQPRASADIGAPPGQVFAALIEPGQLDRWIAEHAEVEPRVGGRYDFGWDGGGPVKILELEPGRVLSYSWEDTWGSDATSEATVVRWELDGSQGRTRLTIVHSGFAPGRRTDDYQVGWLEFLVSLKRMLEVGPSWQPVRHLGS
jgi:uncharacterized protein YndB with AHSA1/START domain